MRVYCTRVLAVRMLVFSLLSASAGLVTYLPTSPSSQSGPSHLGHFGHGTQGSKGCVLPHAVVAAYNYYSARHLFHAHRQPLPILPESAQLHEFVSLFN